MLKASEEFIGVMNVQDMYFGDELKGHDMKDTFPRPLS
jgi:hypothetical protein